MAAEDVQNLFQALGGLGRVHAGLLGQFFVQPLGLDKVLVHAALVHLLQEAVQIQATALGCSTTGAGLAGIRGVAHLAQHKAHDHLGHLGGKTQFVGQHVGQGGHQRVEFTTGLGAALGAAAQQTTQQAAQSALRTTAQQTTQQPRRSACLTAAAQDTAQQIANHVIHRIIVLVIGSALAAAQQCAQQIIHTHNYCFSLWKVIPGFSHHARQGIGESNLTVIP